MQKIIIKRILFICFFIGISLTYCGIMNILTISKQAVKVNATPIANKIIALDARSWKAR